jgi:hypothetical protein
LLQRRAPLHRHVDQGDVEHLAFQHDGARVAGFGEWGSFEITAAVSAAHALAVYWL